MALVIYLKGEGNQALVVKGDTKRFKEAVGSECEWWSFDGWHGKRITIAANQISHVIEESDAQMKKNMEETKKRAEAQSGKVIQTPKFVIPGRGNN